MHGDASGWRFRVHRVHSVIAFVSRCFRVGFASACSGDARACVCVSPRVHRVHSVMALCDYVIACISLWFASLVILRASEMHGHACVWESASAWEMFCLAYVVGLRVLEDRRV